MYLILNHAERIVDISEEARYVKRQENGIVVGCEKADADQIAKRKAYIADEAKLISGVKKSDRQRFKDLPL